MLFISLASYLSGSRLNIFIYFLIYLSVPGLSSGTSDLWSSLWHVGSFRSCSMWDVLVVTCRTLSCSMWDLVPWWGIKPRPLHWDRGVFATGPPGMSLNIFNQHYFSSCIWSNNDFLISIFPVYLPKGKSFTWLI